MKITLVMLLAIVLVGCINIPLGDGNKLKISKDGLVFTDEDGDKTNIAIDKDAGQLSVSGGKEGEEVDFSIGTNVEIPEDFPSDIPLADDAMVIQAAKLNDGEENISITYVTNNDFDSLSALYDDFIEREFTQGENADKEESSMSGTDGILYSLSGERSDGKFMVTIIANQDSEETTNDEDNYKASVTLIFLPTE